MVSLLQGVDHVIHYQMPRTTDGYVHRSGRTARASSSGMSVILQSPEETKAYVRVLLRRNRSPTEIFHLKPLLANHPACLHGWGKPPTYLFCLAGLCYPP